jgi:hypothetical protein
MTIEINNKIKDHVCEILDSVYKSIKTSNSNKVVDTNSFIGNVDFFFGYPRNIKFNFNLLLDQFSQDEVRIEFEVPFILKKKIINE